MDTDNTGLDRQTGDDSGSYQSGNGFGSDRVIHADIGWRGGESRLPVAPKITPLAPAARRRAPAASEPLPIESVILGSSPEAGALRDDVVLAAESEAPVLIIGETGVGKELVARELHRLSRRCAMPFVPLNAGAIPETLAAAEFFGHTKGAFTGAVAEREGAFLAADGGVLFLDEIGDMPLSVQAHLLRVLDDGKVTKIGARSANDVDFRLVAATNVDLRRNVLSGQFRQDLFHRIDVLAINIPPLRERGDDIVEIGAAIIRTQKDEKLRGSILTPKAADRLKTHRFPGNVRELRNVLIRASVRARGGKIAPEHLTFSDLGPYAGGSAEGLNIAKAKDLVARYLAMKALKLTDGNVTRAADLTGRSRGTMQELKRQLGGENFASEYDDLCNQLRAIVDEC